MLNNSPAFAAAAELPPAVTAEAAAIVQRIASAGIAVRYPVVQYDGLTGTYGLRFAADVPLSDLMMACPGMRVWWASGGPDFEMPLNARGDMTQATGPADVADVLRDAAARAHDQYQAERARQEEARAERDRQEEEVAQAMRTERLRTWLAAQGVVAEITSDIVPLGGGGYELRWAGEERVRVVGPCPHCGKSVGSGNVSHMAGVGALLREFVPAAPLHYTGSCCKTAEPPPEPPRPDPALKASIPTGALEAARQRVIAAGDSCTDGEANMARAEALCSIAHALIAMAEHLTVRAGGT